MLYSKNGSIPKPETDGTEGWIEVPDEPIAGEGQEVVWWCPPGWVVRPIKPEQSIQTFTTHDFEGNVISSEDKLADWSWSQSEERWVAYALPVIDVEPTDVVIDTNSVESATANDAIILAYVEYNDFDVAMPNPTIAGTSTPTAWYIFNGTPKVYPI